MDPHVHELKGPERSQAVDHEELLELAIACSPWQAMKKFLTTGGGFKDFLFSPRSLGR